MIITIGEYTDTEGTRHRVSVEPHPPGHGWRIVDSSPRHIRSLVEELANDPHMSSVSQQHEAEGIAHDYLREHSASRTAIR